VPNSRRSPGLFLNRRSRPLSRRRRHRARKAEFAPQLPFAVPAGYRGSVAGQVTAPPGGTERRRITGWGTLPPADCSSGAAAPPRSPAAPRPAHPRVVSVPPIAPPEGEQRAPRRRAGTTPSSSRDNRHGRLCGATAGSPRLVPLHRCRAVRYVLRRRGELLRGNPVESGTMEKIERALEAVGIKFIRENSAGGPCVRLRRSSK
jgi:hypothetical protein